MTSALGYTPTKKALILSAGADFVHVINAPAGSTIPTGTTARIAFYASSDTTAPEIASWTGVVATDRIEWRIESAQADLIENRSKFRLYVTYPETPTWEVLWFIGDVKRIQ